MAHHTVLVLVWRDADGDSEVRARGDFATRAEALAMVDKVGHELPALADDVGGVICLLYIDARADDS